MNLFEKPVYFRLLLFHCLDTCFQVDTLILLRYLLNMKTFENAVTKEKFTMYNLILFVCGNKIN